jgi:hypothetical protein
MYLRRYKNEYKNTLWHQTTNEMSYMPGKGYEMSGMPEEGHINE